MTGLARKEFKLPTPTIQSDVTIRLSSHDVHREADRFHLLGTERYLDRVLNQVTEPRKLAGALLWLAYLAEVRQNPMIFRSVIGQAQRVQAKLPQGASLALVWSRKHRCLMSDGQLDRWLEANLGG